MNYRVKRNAKVFPDTARNINLRDVSSLKKKKKKNWHYSFESIEENYTQWIDGDLLTTHYPNRFADDGGEIIFSLTHPYVELPFLAHTQQSHIGRNVDALALFVFSGSDGFCTITQIVELFVGRQHIVGYFAADSGRQFRYNRDGGH